MTRLHEPPPEMPTNIEAEQAVLGSIMLTNRTIEAVRPILREGHFSEPVHGRIYAASLRLADAGRLADPLTLKREFDADPALEQLGGAKYLARMAAAAQSVQSAAEYARIIQELAVKRELAIVADKLASAARNGAAPMEAWLSAKAAVERVIPERPSGEIGLVDPSTWQAEPEAREWLVQDWVPAGEVVLLGGAGGTGKSLLAQQLLTSAASGAHWLGWPVKGCVAVGVMCEDDAGELHRRQHAINRTLGLDPSRLAGRLHYLVRRGFDNVLMGWGEDGLPRTTPWYEELTQFCLRVGAKLIVLDTLAHCFGGNENDRVQVTQFVSACLYRLAERCGATVVVCSHPSRTGLKDGTGLSGSTAWEGSVRSRLYFSRPEGGEPNERLLERKKSNYASADEKLPLVWADGVIRSLEERSGTARPPVTAVFIDQLRDLKRQNRPVSHKDKANNFAPTVMARMPGSWGYTSAELRHAMEQMLSVGRVKVGGARDSYRRLQEALVLVGEE